MIRQWPLVGRSEELAVIAEATRAGADRARGIVLSGSAGVGKTRVAREALARCGSHGARRRWIVATASARSVPLGAFADVASDFGPDPLRRVREVLDGLIGAGRGELVVCIDDAHLLDDLSAFAVYQLVTRRLANVILTIRSGEASPDAITTIWKDLHLERLELQPLSRAEITHLVEYVLGGPVHSFSAQRLWQYTQGNTLYLRHLLDNEVAAGRLVQVSGIWLWEGQPELSPTLVELVETRIARAPQRIRDVIDALAITEPLDTRVLAAVTDTEALTEAEALGLITVDPTVQPAAVRLSHPILGEVRRSGSLRLRRLRGRIAAEIARYDTTDPRDVVRRAVLAVNSDLPPDPEPLMAAASAAMQLTDLALAETLAEQAVAAGGGPQAKIAHAIAVAWQERGEEAEAILAELADQAAGPMRPQIALLRALNFALILGQTANAEAELDKATPADGEAGPLACALRASIDVARGHAAAAVDRARTVLGDPSADAVAGMLSVWAMVSGLGELGRTDEIESVASRGYQIAEQSAEVSHLRLPLAFLHAYAYRLVGELAQSDATIARIRHDTRDVTVEGAWHAGASWHAFLAGSSALSRGALAEARRLCQESLADSGTGDSGRMRRGIAQLWLATIAGMAGRAAVARREITEILWWDADADAHEWDSEASLAHAWVYAAEGAVSQAVSEINDAVERERRLGRPAWEVLLLQTATQFGDDTTAPRLAALAAEVQGPRAPAAAAHSAGLAAGDGDVLLDASRQYAAFGDRIAATDAAAQAVLAYQNAGLRGSAMSASAAVLRLAGECQGAQTPALRAVTTPQPFTARQREIISLAAQGLANREIARRLAMSVRSVEGHLFRASQRVGANSRNELISILEGS